MTKFKTHAGIPCVLNNFVAKNLKIVLKIGDATSWFLSSFINWSDLRKEEMIKYENSAVDGQKN